MSIHAHTADNGIGSITPSDAHDLLSSARRRETLRIVVSHGTINKSALIDAVAEREYGDPTPQERKRIQVSLAQAHLPKLAAHECIRESGDRITTAANASDVLAFDGDTRSGGLLGRVASAFR